MAQQRDPHELEFIAGLCRRNALHVVKLAWTTHPHIGFDTAGVRWLGRYIETSRALLADDLVEEFVQFAGCFYGECLIATFGGAWSPATSVRPAESQPERIGVRTAGLGITFPFTAVRNQLAHGEARSVAVAYETALEHLAVAAA